MITLSQLETYIDDLSAAAKILADHGRDADVGLGPHLSVPTDAPWEVHRARRNVLAILARLRILLVEPTDFIQHLASQVRPLFQFSGQLHLTMLCRINFSPVYNGWVNSRYLRASQSMAASRLKTSPIWPMCQSYCCVE